MGVKKWRGYKKSRVTVAVRDEKNIKYKKKHRW